MYVHTSFKPSTKKKMNLIYMSNIQKNKK